MAHAEEKPGHQYPLGAGSSYGSKRKGAQLGC